MIKTLKILYQCNLLTFRGIWYLICAIKVVGINLMTLLYISKRFYPQKIAFQDEKDNINFCTLYKQSQHLADQLATFYGVKAKQKIAVMAYNHIYLAHTLFALSVLGADIYLLNAQMSATQFKKLDEAYSFDLIIHDPEIKFLQKENNLLTYHDNFPSIQRLINGRLMKTTQKRKVCHFPKIIVLTSGTTGNFKIAGRSTKAKGFIIPFTALFTKLKLNQYSSIYIATPIYHGFGIATFCIAVLLGSTIFLHKKFTTQEASQLLDKHKIEVITLVPLMLGRLLKYDHTKLLSLKCIISGGSPLAETLVQETQNKLGPMLFNLYGTSEAGICTIATPEDLEKQPSCIGRPINGLHIKLMQDGQEIVKGIGELWIKCAWSIQANKWISTGDLAYKDQHGYFYLQGRKDDMIVSAGENAYPYDLEQQLLEHPAIEEATVIPINDDEFGQRFVAFIILGKNQVLSNEALFTWLRSKVARYQMPKKVIELNEMPITAIGKIDKRQLHTLLYNEDIGTFY
jgi:fatty-acyl-CoA synthase